LPRAPVKGTVHKSVIVIKIVALFLKCTISAGPRKEEAICRSCNVSVYACQVMPNCRKTV